MAKRGCDGVSEEAGNKVNQKKARAPSQQNSSAEVVARPSEETSGALSQHQAIPRALDPKESMTKEIKGEKGENRTTRKNMTKEIEGQRGSRGKTKPRMRKSKGKSGPRGKMKLLKKKT